jgi:hypothetical protein
MRLREQLLRRDEDFQRFVLFVTSATAIPMLAIPATRSFHTIMSYVGGAFPFLAKR